jgi:hypothetical protein
MVDSFYFFENMYHVSPTDIGASTEQILSCRSLKSSSRGRGKRWRRGEAKINLPFGYHQHLRETSMRTQKVTEVSRRFLQVGMAEEPAPSTAVDGAVKRREGPTTRVTSIHMEPPDLSVHRGGVHMQNSMTTCQQEDDAGNALSMLQARVRSSDRDPELRNYTTEQAAHVLGRREHLTTDKVGNNHGTLTTLRDVEVLLLKIAVDGVHCRKNADDGVQRKKSDVHVWTA